MSKVTQNYKKLKPFIAEQNRRQNTGSSTPVASTSVSLTAHDLDGAFHTGNLPVSRVDDALDKTGDTITGNIAANPGVTFDGIDISAHAANVNAHHDAFESLVSDDGTATPDGSNQVTVSGLEAISTTASGSTLQIELSHDGTLDVTANELGVDTTYAYNWVGIHSFAAEVTFNTITNHNNNALFDSGVYIDTVPTIFFDNDINFSGEMGFDFRQELYGRYNATDSKFRFEKSDATKILTVDRDSTYVGIHKDEPTTPLDVGGQILAESLQVDGNVDVLNGGDLTVGPNVLFVDSSQFGVGINKAPDPQFQLDVDGNTRTSGYFVGKHAIQLDDAIFIVHFDGFPEVNSDFTGVTETHKGQSAITEGALIYTEGKFGKALQFTPETTNAVENPSFETSLNNWSQVTGTGGTITRSAEFSKYGDYSAKLTAGSAGSVQLNSSSVSISNGETVYYSAYGYSETSNSDVFLILFNETDTAIEDFILLDEVDQWQLLQGSWTNTTGSNKNVYLRFQNGEEDSSTSAFFDAAMLHTTGFHIDYFDASMDNQDSDGNLSNVVWSLTEHESTSEITTYPTVQYNSVSVKWNKFSFMCWVKIPDSASNIGDNLVIANLNAGGTDQLVLRIDDGTDKIDFVSAKGGSICNSTTTIAPNTWYHIAVTANNNVSKVYVNGVLEDTISDWNIVPVGTPNIYIGNNNIGSDDFIGKIDDIVILDAVASEDLIRTVYESNAPVFAETSSSFFRSPSTTIWVDHEGLYGRDANGFPIIALSTVDSKSWAGNTLDAGDFMLGSTSAGYLLFDTSEPTFNLVDVVLSLYDGATEVFRIDPEVLSIAIGNPRPTYSTGTGFFAGEDAGSYKFRVGTASNDRLVWDGANLTVEGTINVTSGSSGYANLGDRPADNVVSAEFNAFISGTDQLTIISGGEILFFDGNTKTYTSALLSGLTSFPTYAYVYDQSNGSTSIFTTTDFSSVPVNGIVIGVAYSGSQKATWAATLGSKVYIGDGAIVSNSITASEIAANTITATQIVANTITASQIASNTITANEIASNTITASQIAANTITASQIASGTITASQIASGTITATQISGNQLDVIATNTGTLTVDESISAASGDILINDDGITINESDGYTFSSSLLRFKTGSTELANFGFYHNPGIGVSDFFFNHEYGGRFWFQGADIIGQGMTLFDSKSTGLYIADFQNDQVSGGHVLNLDTAGTGTGSYVLNVKTGTYNPIFRITGTTVNSYAPTIINTPTAQTIPLRIQRDGAGVLRFVQNSTQQYMQYENRDMGNNNPGSMIFIGANISTGAADKAPGLLALRRASNVGWQYVWSDDSGDIRTIVTNPPTGRTASASYNANTVGNVVGTQGSTLDIKDITNYKPSVFDSIDRIKSAKEAVKGFIYKNKRYNSEHFDAGIVIDYAPHYGMDRCEEYPQGKSLNDIKLFGDTVLTLNYLLERNEALDSRLEKLERLLRKAGMLH